MNNLEKQSAVTELLKQDRFREFTEQPESGIYRPKGKGGNVSPLSLGVFGFHNHETGQHVSLNDLLSNHDIDLNNLPVLKINKASSQPAKKKVSPEYIYRLSRPDNQTVRRYFKTRGLDITDELIKELDIRL